MAEDLKLSIGLAITPDSLRRIRQQIEKELEGAGVNTGSPQIKGASSALAKSFNARGTDRLDIQRAVITKFQDEIDRNTATLKTYEGAVSKTKGRIEEYSRKISENQAQLDFLNTSINKLSNATTPSYTAIRDMAKEAASVAKILGGERKILDSLNSTLPKLEKEFKGLSDAVSNSQKALGPLKDVVRKINSEVVERFKNIVPDEVAKKAVKAGQSLADVIGEFDKTSGEISQIQRELAALTTNTPEELESEMTKLSDELSRIRVKLAKAFARADDKRLSTQDKQGETDERAKRKDFQKGANEFRLSIKERTDRVKDAVLIQQEDNDAATEAFAAQAKIRKERIHQADLALRETRERERQLQEETHRKGVADKNKREIKGAREAEAIENERLGELHRSLFLLQKDADLGQKLLRIKEQQLDKEQAIVAAINRRLRAEQVKTKTGGDARISSLSDVSAGFAQVAGKDQAKFLKVIDKQQESLKKSSDALRSHNGNIAQGSVLVDRLTQHLNSGQKAAFQFGFATSDAASRLLAWAAPASFLFGTINALKDATRELTQLDSQARRLAFFQAGNADIGNSFKSIGEASESMRKQVTKNTNAIISEARNSGLSIKQITDAAIAIEKVGESAFSDKGNPEALLKAAEGMIRLEGSTLGADAAVELLFTAIAQGTSSIPELNAALKDAESFAAQFAGAAGRARFGLEDFLKITTGIQPAFKSIQGIGTRELNKLIEVATKFSGAPNPSRLTTGLRQVGVLITKNADKIKELTGVQVENEDGTSRGTDGLLDFLDAIKELSGTSQAITLTKLGFDQDQIAIGLGLANAAGELRKEFAKIKEDTEALSTKNDVQNFFAGQVVGAESLEASYNKLDSTITAFAKNANLDKIKQSTIDFATSGITLVEKLVNTFAEFKEGLIALGVIIGGPLLLKATKFAGAFAGGVLRGGLSSQLSQESKGQLLSTNKDEVSTLQQVAVARKEGVLSAKESLEIEKKTIRATDAQNKSIRQISIAQGQLTSLKNANLGSSAKAVRLEADLIALQSKLERGLLVELKLRERIAGATNKTLISGNSTKLKQGLTTAAGGALLAGGLLVADPIGEAVGGAVGEAISSAIQGALIGGTVGAAFGSAIPGLGTIAGAAIGAVGGAAIAGFTALSAAEAKLSKDLEERRRQIQGIDDAAKQQIERERSLHAQTIKDAEKQSKAQLDLAVIQQSIREVQIELNREQAKGDDGKLAAAAKLRELTFLEKQEKQIAFKIGKEEVVVLQRKLEVEKEILAVKNNQARQSSVLSTLEQLAIANLKDKTLDEAPITKVKITFDRAQIALQIDALEKEITKRKNNIEVSTDPKIKDDEEKAIAGINEQIKNIRVGAVNAEVLGVRQILTDTRKDANRIIDAWKQAGDELVDSFREVMSIQERISATFVASLEQQGRLLELSKFDPSKFKSFGLDNFAKEAIDAANKIENLTKKRGLINSTFDAQAAPFRERLNKFQTPGDAPGPEITTITDAFRQSFKDTGAVIDEEIRGRREGIRLNLEALKINIDNEKKITDLEINKQRQLADNIGELIGVYEQQISQQKELIELEAQRGRKLVENPQEVIKNLQDVIGAKGILSAGGLNTKTQDIGAVTGQITDIVRNLQGKAGGDALLRKLVAGVDAGIERGVKFSAATTGEEFRDILLSVVNSSGNSTLDSNANKVNRTQDAVSNIGDLGAKIQDLVGNLKGFDINPLLEQQRKLEGVLLEIAKSRQDTAEGNLASNFGVLTKKFSSIEELEKTDTLILKEFGDKIAPQMSDFFQAGFPDGIETIRESIDFLRQSLESSSSKSLPKEVAELFETTAKEFSTSVSMITEALRTRTRQDVAEQSINSFSVKVNPVDIDVGGEGAQGLIKAIGEAASANTAVAQKLLERVTGLEASVLEGVKVNFGKIDINIESSITQEINASKDLNDLLVQITGGNQSEIERIKSIIVKLISREIERDSGKVSVQEKDFSETAGPR